ncbi:MAG: hypothetical protein HYW15_00885 [Candidatus Giovannonibacteria bacterium]|nr:MAG: hypothetical protein HYW15_00885 [Candidatus Giovannonibacteria bacterium]
MREIPSFITEITTKSLRLLVGLVLSVLLFKFLLPTIFDSEFIKLAVSGASMAGFFKPFSEMKWYQALIMLVVLIGIFILNKVLDIPKKYESR